MASALAMILAAGMAVPGIGPEMPSGEVERPQGLDIAGRWEGICWADGEVWRAEVSNRCLVMTGVSGEAVSPFKKASGGDHWDIGELWDKGGGKVIIWRRWLGNQYNGIYKWEDDRLIICFRGVEYGYPTSFQADKHQWLLILRQVKPRK